MTETRTKTKMAMLDLQKKWNGTMTIKHVPQLWRGVLPDNTLSANQRQLYLTEEGVYFFVCRSDNDIADQLSKASQILVP